MFHIMIIHKNNQTNQIKDKEIFFLYKCVRSQFFLYSMRSTFTVIRKKVKISTNYTYIYFIHLHHQLAGTRK